VSSPQKANLRHGESVLAEAAQHTGRGAKKSDPQTHNHHPIAPLGECGAAPDGKVPSRRIYTGVILTKRVMFTLQSPAQE